MKSPNNFFSTREGFEKRMMDLLSKWTKKFLYRCYSCSNFFQSVDELNAHNTLWCQMQYRNAAELNVSKLFPEPEVSNASTDRTMSDRDRREEMIQHLAHLEALSNSCNDCTKQTIDFRAHLTMHSNATLLPPQQQNVASDDVDNATTVEVTPIRVTRQRLETIGRQAAASLPDSRPGSVVEIRPTVDEVVAQESSKPEKTIERRPSRVESPAPKISSDEPTEMVQTTRKRGRPSTAAPSTSVSVSPNSPKVAFVPPSSSLTQHKLVKLKVIDAKPFVETLGIDVPSNRRLLAFNRLDRQALAFGSTVKEIVRVRKSNFCCALCSFESDSKDEFQSHIVVHKPVVVKGVVGLKSRQDSKDTTEARDGEVPAECFQCKECGMCFATEPSWKKHLFLLHRIKNPGPEYYCQDLTSSQSESER